MPKTGDRIIPEPGVVEPVYFGCWNSTGHFFHGVGGKSVTYDRTTHTHYREPSPWGRGYTVEKLAPGGNVQGRALLHHKDGWTALAVDDFTVDHRGNSKSVFCFPETLTADEAYAKAAELFPHIVARIGPVEVNGTTLARTVDPVPNDEARGRVLGANSGSSDPSLTDQESR